MDDRDSDANRERGFRLGLGRQDLPWHDTMCLGCSSEVPVAVVRCRPVLVVPSQSVQSAESVQKRWAGSEVCVLVGASSATHVLMSPAMGTAAGEPSSVQCSSCTALAPLPAQARSGVRPE